NLTELDLRDCEAEDVNWHWLSHFPDSHLIGVSSHI
nr:hypothetical protein [Tanacetum cinerariifolium]